MLDPVGLPQDNFPSASKESKAPPIGLRPRFIVTTNRIQEIDMAIERYQRCHAPVPQEWWDERAELLRWLVENRPGLVAARELHI